MSEETKKREKLPWWFAPAWSTRATSLGLNVVLIGYLTYYCTDMLGMSAGLVGTLLLLSKLCDGVSDLIVGFIIDKTHTRWGKARPYEISIIFVWLFTVLAFSVPDMGEMAQTVYVFIMYTLINAVFATCLNGSDAVYLARSVREEENRVKVLSINGIIMMVFIMLFSVLMPQMIVGIGTTKAGWQQMVIMLAIPLAIIGMLRFIFIKEVNVDEVYDQDKETQKISFKESLHAIAGNKYIFIVAAALLIVNILNNMGAATTYYFKYIVGDIGLQSLVSLAGLITPVILIFYPLFTKKLGNTKVLQGGALIGVIGLTVRSIGGTNLITIIIGSVCSSLAFVPIGMMVNVYLIECMDYGEWKNGTRIEGALASITSFASKVGSALASSLTGLIMGLAGYDGSLAVQSDSALASIVATYNYLPLVLYIVVFVLTLFYNMDKIKPQIQADLAAKRAK